MTDIEIALMTGHGDIRVRELTDARCWSSQKLRRSSKSLRPSRRPRRSAAAPVWLPRPVRRHPCKAVRLVEALTHMSDGHQHFDMLHTAGSRQKRRIHSTMAQQPRHLHAEGAQTNAIAEKRMIARVMILTGYLVNLRWEDGWGPALHHRPAALRVREAP